MSIALCYHRAVRDFSPSRFDPELQAAIEAHLRRKQNGDGTMLPWREGAKFRCLASCSYCEFFWVDEALE